MVISSACEQQQPQLVFCVHVCPPSVIADSEQEEDESLQSKYPQAVNLTKRAATD